MNSRKKEKERMRGLMKMEAAEEKATSKTDKDPH